MTGQSLVIQFMALVLFGACIYHSWIIEGRRSAVQWFFVGYLYALLLVNLLVVSTQIAYDPEMLVIGAAPSLTIMLYPAVFYLAYTIAKTWTDPTNLGAMAYLIFLLTAAILLPLDMTAITLGWWSFPSQSADFLNGVPFYLPFAWGFIAAGFWLMMGRIRKIRFRGNGQLFAMVIAAPLVAGLMFILVAIIQILVSGLALFGNPVLYGFLALIFLVLPLLLILNVPHVRAVVTKQR